MPASSIASHRFGKEALEILAGARPRVGLVADVIDRHVGQRLDVGLGDLPLAAVRGQGRRYCQIGLEPGQPVDEASALASGHAPGTAAPTTCESSAIFAIAEGILKRITWSIMMPLARP